MFFIKPYTPGKFYERELPCLLQVLKKVKVPLDVVVIDGYVWLGENSPGLGAYLYCALGKKVPVIGVAKSKFKGSEHAEKVFRGNSKRPLYITAAGIDPEVATKNTSHMHGTFRIPTLLKKVDFLCRSSKGVTPL
ncbi:MAG: endonuclease V [Proteobacteria bacterium]|nr:endonuclease V [Pseudomonadota bacterium]